MYVCECSGVRMRVCAYASAKSNIYLSISYVSIHKNKNIIYITLTPSQSNPLLHPRVGRAQRRWFVLRGSTLTYSVDKHAQLSGSIELSPLSAVKVSE